jgi:curved DNA-binding protein
VDAQRDYYAILGVPRDATIQEIQRAYRRLAHRYHPDVSHDPDAERTFKQITQAYRVLADPARRRQYDRETAHASRARTQTTAVPVFPWFSTQPGDYLHRTWIGGSPFDTSNSGAFDNDDVLADRFASHASNEQSHRRRAEAVDVPISIEEAYRGTQRTITITSGDRKHSININIPAGAIDGHRIRLDAYPAGAGGIDLIVRITPHPRYRLDQRDIEVDLPVTPWEAALGATVTIETPHGTERLQIPPGTSSGQRLRLNGRGLPNPHDKPGDLYAIVRIVTPPALSDAERELFARLAAASTFSPRA